MSISHPTGGYFCGQTQARAPHTTSTVWRHFRGWNQILVGKQLPTNSGWRRGQARAPPACTEGLTAPCPWDNAKTVGCPHGSPPLPLLEGWTPSLSPLPELSGFVSPSHTMTEVSIKQKLPSHPAPLGAHLCPCAILQLPSVPEPPSSEHPKLSQRLQGHPWRGH